MGNSPLTAYSPWGGGEQPPPTTTTKREGGETSSFLDSKRVVEWLVGVKGGQLPEGFGTIQEVDLLVKELSTCNRSYLRTVCGILCPSGFLEKITRVASRKRRSSQTFSQTPLTQQQQQQQQQQRQRRQSQPTFPAQNRTISFPFPTSASPPASSPSSTPVMPPSSSPTPAEQRRRERERQEDRETKKIIEEGLSSLMAAKRLLFNLTNDHLDCLKVFLDSARFEESQALDCLCSLLRNKSAQSLSTLCPPSSPPLSSSSPPPISNTSLTSQCPDLLMKPFILPPLRNLLQTTTDKEFGVLCLSLPAMSKIERKTLLTILSRDAERYKLRKTLCAATCSPSPPFSSPSSSSLVFPQPQPPARSLPSGPSTPPPTETPSTFNSFTSLFTLPLSSPPPPRPRVKSCSIISPPNNNSPIPTSPSPSSPPSPPVNNALVSRRLSGGRMEAPASMV